LGVSSCSRGEKPKGVDQQQLASTPPTAVPSNSLSLSRLTLESTERRLLASTKPVVGANRGIIRSGVSFSRFQKCERIETPHQNTHCPTTQSPCLSLSLSLSFSCRLITERRSAVQFLFLDQNTAAAGGKRSRRSDAGLRGVNNRQEMYKWSPYAPSLFACLRDAGYWLARYTVVDAKCSCSLQEVFMVPYYVFYWPFRRVFACRQKNSDASNPH